MDRIICPLEIKLAGGDNVGTIRGYGSVFGNVDSYGDTGRQGRVQKNNFRREVRRGSVARHVVPTRG
jgi:hypothetical protein